MTLSETILLPFYPIFPKVVRMYSQIWTTNSCLAAKNTSKMNIHARKGKETIRNLSDSVIITHTHIHKEKETNIALSYFLI